ncbi:tyrosine-protein kinase receptor TYRO3 isoform X2 [Anas platyrhynchos]|uniref:tyrosine-protein kinase receptor TYRO3 isoform X2 n=1 Tax=Anas platyrhynchos TaxID=8839 RepID=UPI000F7C946B|eukprot:XP_027313665.1 tyrosine-protein kinase receptor TYRO3 isoform X2 [Anas platyrhynchos]
MSEGEPSAPRPPGTAISWPRRRRRRRDGPGPGGAERLRAGRGRPPGTGTRSRSAPLLAAGKKLEIPRSLPGQPGGAEEPGDDGGAGAMELKRGMALPRLLLLGLWAAALRDGAAAAAGMKFTGSPIKLKVSQGQPVKLNCSLEGMEDPEMLWIKDGAVVQSVDQVYIPVDEEHWIGFLSLKSVERTDSGKYWCQVENGGKKEESQQVWLIVEGVPYFTVEPEDVSVSPNAPFHMACAAVGPPEPVTIVWWMGDSRVGLPDISPSILNVSAMPLPPLNVTVSQVTSSNASVVWVPGFDGRAPLHSCTLQVAESPDGQEVSTEVAPVPPFAYGVQGLKHSTNYSVRVQCSNEMGSSPFTDRVYFQTLELAPSSTPQNIHVIQRDPGLVLEWEGVAPDVLKENVLGYRLEWIQDNITQGEMIVQDTKANLTTWNPLKDLIIRVCVLNSAGCGPWSDFFLLEAQEVMGGQRQPPYGTSWVPVALGILTALVTAVALALILLRKRRKETRFGHAFGSVVGRGDPAVHFRAARSFNREGPELIEATLESVGISDELKTKLKDVLIQEQQFTLGRMLGKGEFGSVREALLKLDDGSFQKVAVKMLKADIFTSTDIEEFLREAACMKEFDHPHVTKLIGVSLRSRPKGRLPIPMVILPFMKHGDLHAFLLMSRIGENPFNLPVQTLLKFMIDIASGMEYLSSKNFIHRDLAARNCMLDENMNVSVADFGLSKKIYSGDYYRQGCASKLPVKWLALESLADNLYTTHSDVWAFGVTMWEIVTRGQTPYAGIENAEIYNYLISGNRLKQPPECLEDVYDLMCRCWHPEPKLRPSFAMLRYQLEMIRGRMSTLSASQDPLYVNIGKDKEASGSDPALHASFANTDGDETVAGAAAAVTSDYRYIMSPLCLGDDAEAARHPDGQEGEDKSLLYELETEGEKSC